MLGLLKCAALHKSKKFPKRQWGIFASLCQAKIYFVIHESDETH